MTETTTTRRRAGAMAFALAGLSSLAGCAAPVQEDGSAALGTRSLEVITATTPGIAVDGRDGSAADMDGAANLVRIDVNPSHHVTFWELAPGRVAVQESYNMVANPGGTALADYRVGRDSLVSLYESLVQGTPEPYVVERLELADERQRQRQAARGAEPSLEHREIQVDWQAEVDAPLIPKGALSRETSDAENTAWFFEQCESRRHSASGEEESLCATEAIPFNEWGWTQTVNRPNQYEMSQVMLANWSESAASIRITGYDCGFLELGLCSGIINHYLDVAPYWASDLIGYSDDGFLVTLQGYSFGGHYLFWD